MIPRSPAPALLVVAAFSRHVAALDWGAERLGQAYGPVALASNRFATPRKLATNAVAGSS